MNDQLSFLRAARAALVFLALATAWPGAGRADVVFRGLDAAQEANARALVPLASAGCETNSWRVQRLFRDADRELRLALQALGYYHIEFEKRLSQGEDCWHAEFDVRPGEPVRYRVIDIRIEGDVSKTGQLADTANHGRPTVGAVLNHGDYEQYKRRLIQQLSNQGYFDAKYMESEVVVEPETRSADLHLHLDSGPRYRYGEITFTEGILSERLLENYTDIHTGEYYDAKDISALYESLNGSGYFKSVSIRTDPVDDEHDTAPVDVSLTPGIRRSYNIGAGFATDTGPQGRLGYIDRRRNERGHQFEARLFVSDTESELTGTYRWPVANPRTDWASIVGGVHNEDTDTSESITYKLGVLRTRKLVDDWLWTRYSDLVYENFTIADQDEWSRLLIFGVNFESAIGREVTRSANGRRINIDLRGAAVALGSDTSFLQLRATAKRIWSLNEKYRLILRGRLGATMKDELTDLPASVRFFAGGDRSVRGYDLESLGPVDADGVVIGGSHLLEASVEFDRLIADRWSIAAFADTGSAFNNFDPKFSTGVGLGVRWYSPVGPIRVDFAHPLDDPNNNFRLHVTLGPDL